MTQTHIIDCLIYRLKELPECEDVRFVREYPGVDSETPVTGFLASVGIKSVERAGGYLGGLVPGNARGELFTAEGEIRVYAPKSKNGNGLSQRVFAILKELETAHGGNSIIEAKAGSIEFDTDLSAVFRRVSFKMEFCERGEDC